MLLHCPVRYLFTAILLLAASPASGHGARISWEIQGDSIRISASFDDGCPMDQAQVTVFSGAAPSEPYITGITDENGKFAFLPDDEESKLWDVQVRKAGHGDIVHISLADDADIRNDHGGFSALQIILMSGCVVWGFTGTALFFSSKRKRNNAHT